MLVNADARALEWYAAVYLSQDPVGMKELIDGRVDQHQDNQERLGLPSRLIAKIFLFRLIFGGTAPAYANDYDFKDVGWSNKQWQKAIDLFYEKYKGLEHWHNQLMYQVQLNKCLVMPTGRIYTFEPYLKHGELIFPRTQILNYPVQGLGADLMSVARILLRRYMLREKLTSLLISTVHDSILIDAPDHEVKQVVDILHKVWDDIPAEFQRRFNVPFNLPLRVEVQIGQDWGNMKEIKDAY